MISRLATFQLQPYRALRELMSSMSMGMPDMLATSPPVLETSSSTPSPTPTSTDSSSLPTSAPTVESDADRDFVIPDIQGNSESSSSGVTPGQTAMIVLFMCAALAIGLVALRRTLLSRSSNGSVVSGSAASGSVESGSIESGSVESSGSVAPFT
jgi:hypothetical protein